MFWMTIDFMSDSSLDPELHKQLLQRASVFSQAITASLDPAALNHLILAKLKDVFACDMASFGTLNAHGLLIYTGMTDSEGKLRMVDELAPFGGLGVMLQAVLQRELINIPDVSECDFYLHTPTLTSAVIQSEVAIPLIYNNEPTGALCLHSTVLDYFSPDHHLALSSLAPIISIALNNARLYGEVQERARRLHAVVQVMRDMPRSLDVESLAGLVIDSLKANLGCDYANIALASDTHLVFMVSHTLRPPYPNQVLLNDQNRLTLVYRHAMSIIVSNLETDETLHRQPSLPTSQSAFTVPLYERQRVIGVLDLQFNQPNAFNNEDIELVEAIASHLGITTSNFQLFDNLQDERMVLNERNRQLESLNQMKDDLTTMIVHDLRTPLNALQLLLERIQVTADTERRGRQLKLAMRSLAQMTALVNNMLDITRLESGQLRLNPVQLPASELINYAIEALRLEAELDDKPLRLETPRRLPFITVDRALIERVLLNLVSNAVRYSPAGSPIIISASTNPTHLHISISDQGPGIPPDQIGHIFEKYVRLPNSGRVGLGLGLAFCRMAVHAHRGQITVQSTVGRGSTFAIALPFSTTDRLINEALSEDPES